MVLLDLIQTDSLSLVLDLLQEQKEINKKLVEIIGQKKPVFSTSDIIAIVSLFVNSILAYFIYNLGVRNIEKKEHNEEAKKKLKAQKEKHIELKKNQVLIDRYLTDLSKMAQRINHEKYHLSDIIYAKDTKFNKYDNYKSKEQRHIAQEYKNVFDDSIKLQKIFNEKFIYFEDFDSFENLNKKIDNFNRTVKQGYYYDNNNSSSSEYLQSLIDSINKFRAEYNKSVENK
ncbi:hypothetical protein [Flammeovirga sp. OC4]|uniref:hypothetical protein n=1 Tax=Flammeovirga sp. OC4 TaxID=1382345 RepID=UPI0005C4A920|nr:hypothetical protein [Flammeovirga sp. OC4]